MSYSRRDFIATTGKAMALLSATGTFDSGCGREQSSDPPRPHSIRITQVDCRSEREPMIRPFGFKGGFLSEIWQVATLLESESGICKIGLYNPSVLWSDANVFSAFSEDDGNALMVEMTRKALEMVKGMTFSDPLELLDRVLGPVHEYGKQICKNPDLRKTFTLNSLVGFDNAAWLLYAHENGISNFDQMIPEPYRMGLSYRQDKVASIPLMAYSVPIEDIRLAAQQGYFFMKIKIGQPGTQDEMLAKDKARIEAIHKTVGEVETPHTADGKIPYYFDANGRYEQEETLLRLLDHAKQIGAFDRIAIIEEPFPETNESDVSDLCIRIAADESAHTDEDAVKRIQMGYKAIAVKAIAKTLSMTMKIVKVAHENMVPCFCADLTVNPILVDWNKNVAARLSPFPETGLGLLETNGHQNYRNWDKMVSYHPCAGASWMASRDGVFNLDEDFYQRSGGIFLPSPHYEALFQPE
jgi:hypothetical protein